MSKANYPEIRDILLVDIKFKDNKTGNVRISQKRPFVVMKKNDDEIALQTITSRINKYPANTYGVLLKKDQQNGLKSDSSLLCTKDNGFLLAMKKLKTVKKQEE
ncbi:hypothetical protein D7Z54_18980 [Salibacterium salarium]|uniref:Uncharacterized protein n=1 Tax=Salibacterium salarium TaxID=284579 RepID=A0A3R9P5N0_9BACI|nr:hypothetical protein [Salibacterium salarium]RSL31718.1 hypothetical protein D7Z54_18980 [Salibacterium salarium]